ncbi:YceI family protein [Fundidesulfovibrio soli]|uniref:YceI family protein n=1 Tax=Fundidesulfovibrio soli TaxID=2922716 RepID=UPI001FAF600E|nr:YceI family protein [Fundidesulfovibrio soli]
MKTRSALCVICILLCALSQAEAAQPAREFVFDPPHCAITFKVRHIFVEIPGRFAEYGGTVRFDPGNLAGSVFDVTVKAASLDTFVDKRNEHLRSPDFFDAAKFPDISFKSSKIQRVSAHEFTMTGTLTLKGVSKVITLPLTYHGMKIHPMDPKVEVAGFSAKLNIFMPDYSFCDPKWSEMGVLGQNALVEIGFELASPR